MQQFFNTDHISREKGFRCHKKRNRFWDIATLEHSQARHWNCDRIPWTFKCHLTMCVELTLKVRVPILQITWQNGVRPSAVVWECFLRWALMKSRNKVVFTEHLLLWSLNQQILDRLHSMLFIIETKQSQRLLQIESATAWSNPQRP